jgi:hypothetical protein
MVVVGELRPPVELSNGRPNLAGDLWLEREKTGHRCIFPAG